MSKKPIDPPIETRRYRITGYVGAKEHAFHKYQVRFLPGDLVMLTDEEAAVFGDAVVPCQ